MDPVDGRPHRDAGTVPDPSRKTGAIDERMARWFFCLIGTVLLVSSFLLWSWSAVIACIVALGAVATFGFRALAPPDRTVAFATDVLAVLQM